MVVAPLLSAVILLSMMGRGLPMRLPCAVVDLDHTEVSRSVLTTLDALQYAEKTTVKSSAKSGKANTTVIARLSMLCNGVKCLVSS